MKRISCFLSLIIFLASAPKAISQEISPMLVGVNVWYSTLSEEVWSLTEQSGVSSLRIGGHSYDDNMPSKTQLKDWVTRIQEMGAEPILQMSQYAGAAAAADLVEYFNVELATGKPIKYWNIGNEPWLQNGRPALNTVGAMVAAYFKPIAVAMKEVDPTIKIYGPDFCYYIGEAIADLYGSGSVNDLAGKIPGKDYYYSDGISWHRYPQDDNINLAYAGIEDFKGSIIACKEKVDEVNAAYNRTGDDALGWGIGEYNAKGGSVVHTWMNGHMYGGVLDLCMKYGATYATSWSMFENGGNRQGTDFSFIDGANMVPRANYRHMEFVSKYFHGEYRPGTSSLSDIIVSGSREADTISVMIMNRAENPVSYTLYLNNDTSAEAGVTLNLDAMDDRLHMDMIDGKATHVLVFKDDEIFKINYTSNHFDNELPPEESYVIQASFVPQAPSGLIAADPTYNSLSLSWETAENDTITGFQIERKKKTDDSFQIVAIVSNSSSEYRDAGLDALETYVYRIRSYNSAGYSDYSNESEATTLDYPEKIAFNGPHSIPGKIEVEDFNDNEEGWGYHDSEPENQGGAYRTDQGVDIETCTDIGGGYNIGYIESGEWLEYLIEDISDGTYDIAVRTASNNDTDTKRFKLYLNEEYLGYFSPEYTAGWQTWQTLVKKGVNISGGDNQILKILFEGSSFNLNWIEFGTDLGTVIDAPRVSDLIASYNSNNRTIFVSSTKSIEYADIRLFDCLGRIYLSIKEQDFVSKQYPVDLHQGIYFLTLSSGEENLTSKLYIQ